LGKNVRKPQGGFFDSHCSVISLVSRAFCAKIGREYLRFLGDQLITLVKMAVSMFGSKARQSQH